MLAVTLDLDDTLWPIGPVIDSAETVLLRWFRDHAPRVLRHLDREGLRRLRADEERAAPELAHDLTELRLRSIRRALELAGHPASLADVALEAFMRARNSVTLFPEVRSALAVLSTRHRLGAISNGNADLETIGIGHLFGFHVTARSVGTAKPAGLIFDEAVRRAGVPREQVVHVGDDAEHDVAGAKAAGLRAVWLDRGGSDDAPVDADAVIHDLSELASLLAREDWARIA